jgi:hypothetical protein
MVCEPSKTRGNLGVEYSKPRPLERHIDPFYKGHDWNDLFGFDYKTGYGSIHKDYEYVRKGGSIVKLTKNVSGDPDECFKDGNKGPIRFVFDFGEPTYYDSELEERKEGVEKLLYGIEVGLERQNQGRIRRSHQSGTAIGGAIGYGAGLVLGAVCLPVLVGAGIGYALRRGAGGVMDYCVHERDMSKYEDFNHKGNHVIPHFDPRKVDGFLRTDDSNSPKHLYARNDLYARGDNDLGEHSGEGVDLHRRYMLPLGSNKAVFDIFVAKDYGVDGRGNQLNDADGNPLPEVNYAKAVVDLWVTRDGLIRGRGPRKLVTAEGLSDIVVQSWLNATLWERRMRHGRIGYTNPDA